MLDNIFGNMDVVQKSLGGLTTRQRALSENIANADTPQYKRIQVSFEGQLRDAIKGKRITDELPMKTSSQRHFDLGPGGNISDVNVMMTQVTDESYRNDKNNVDIEVEMATLAETNVRFNTMATLARNKFEGLKSTLREIR